MAKDSGSTPTVDLVTAVADVAPIVGNVLGTLVRMALSKNEFETIGACLKEAMSTDHTGQPPGKLHFRKRWRAKKESGRPQRGVRGSARFRRDDPGSRN